MQVLKINLDLITSKLSLFILYLSSWKIKNSPPITSKYVLIAAPHTSNWDFPLMLLTSYVKKVQLNWMGKKSLFNWPFGSIMSALGGVPIDREKKGDVVIQTSEKIVASKKFILVIPPEGTRSRSEFWKSGFLHIARASNVPIVFSSLDYKKKEISFSAPVNQNLKTDQILLFANNFYKNIVGLNQENFGPIKFKDKSD